MDGRGIWIKFPARKEISLFPTKIQCDPGAQPTSYAIGKWGYFLAGKAVRT
jgi:hypothetical protein